MATNNNRTTALSRDQRMMAGVQKHLVDQSFVVDDKRYSTQEIVAVYEGRIATGQAVATARAQWQAALKADREKRTATGVFTGAFRGIVQGMFHNPGTLSDFGLSPRKSTKKTVNTKATAIAKSTATRKARGTLGKRQKSKIKGDPGPLAAAPHDGSAKAPPAVSKTASNPA